MMYWRATGPDVLLPRVRARARLEYPDGPPGGQPLTLDKSIPSDQPKRPMRNDALFQCRYSGIGMMHRRATGPDALRR